MPSNPFSPKKSPFSIKAPRTKNPFGKQERALETKGSGFEKTMRVLNTPSSTEYRLLLNALQGKRATEGVIAQAKGKEEQTSGSDVLKQVFLRNKTPDTKLGRAALGVSGFVLDVLNPADPLNWIAVGQVTKAAKAISKLGKLAKFSKGLQEGQRSLLSLKFPFTANAVWESGKALNKPAGALLEGVGKFAKALPGAERIGKFVAPPFKKLRTYANKIASQTPKFVNAETELAKLDGLKKLQKQATKEIESGALQSVNPKMAEYYKRMGYDANQIIGREVRRIFEAPISAAAKVKNQLAVQFLTKVPTKGDTTPAVKAIVEMMGPSLARQGAAKSGRHLEGAIEGFFPRPISEETRLAVQRAGGQVGSGLGGGRRVFKEYTTEQVEAMSRDPEMRSKIFMDTIGKDALKSNPKILDMFKKADPQAADFYEGDVVKAFGKELESTAKEVSTADAVKDILTNPALARKIKKGWAEPDVIRVPIPEKYKSMMIGEKMRGQKNIPVGHVYMTRETAGEFNKMMGLLNDEQKFNQTVGGVQGAMMALTNIFKRVTLLSFPGTLPYSLRNIMSNTLQSGMAGALSARGLAVATYMTNLLARTAKNPRLFEEGIARLGQKYGLDMGQELKILKDSNVFGEAMTKEFFEPTKKLRLAEKAIGVGVGAKMAEIGENFGRIQHYITRRLQGWEPDAAIDDVRKYLYDYVGGMSPQMAKFRAFFPFMSWSRYNLPIMLEHMIKRPAKMAAPYRAKLETENTLGLNAEGGKPDERALDEFVKGDLHVRLWQDPKTGKWTYWRLKGQIPMADLEDLTSLEKFFDLMTSSLTPFVKTPVENLFNQSLFFRTPGGERAPIENYPGQTGKFLGVDLGRKAINVLRNVRPLAEVNKWIPSTDAARLNVPEQAIRLAGLSGLTPVDMTRSISRAKQAYQQRLGQHKLSRKIQEKLGRPTEPIDALLKQLAEQSFAVR